MTVKALIIPLLLILALALDGSAQDPSTPTPQDYIATQLHANVVAVNLLDGNADFVQLVQRDVERIRRETNMDVRVTGKDATQNVIVLTATLFLRLEPAANGILPPVGNVGAVGRIKEFLSRLPYVREVQLRSVPSNGIPSPETADSTPDSTHPIVADAAQLLLPNLRYEFVLRLVSPATRLLAVTGSVATVPHAWPREAPVMLAIAGENGEAVHSRYEILPPAPDSATIPVHLHLPITAGQYVIEMTADPKQIVNEPAEDNNVRSITVNVPPLDSGIQQDLFLVGGDASVGEFELTASTSSPALPEVIRSVITERLGPLPYYVSASVVMPPAPIPETDRASPMPGNGNTIVDSPMTSNFDLIVHIAFTQWFDGLPHTVEETVKYLAQEWYIREARSIDHQGGTIGPNDNIQAAPIARPVVQLGIYLAPTDEARRYWRVTIPVGRAVKLASATNDTGPSRVAVQYRPLLATATGDSSLLDTFTDYVHLLPNHPEISVGIFEKRINAALPVQVVVDPNNVVPEIDEANNRFVINPQRPPNPIVDFVAVCEKSTVSAVDVTANAANPFLVELVGKTVLQSLGPLDAFEYVNVFPWNVHVIGTQKLFAPIPAEFDLVVLAKFATNSVRLDEIFVRLKSAIESQWYAATVHRLDILPLWLTLRTIAVDNLSGMLVLGVQLADVETVVPYWRVETVVVREPNSAAPATSSFGAQNGATNVVQRALPVQFRIPGSIDATIQSTNLLPEPTVRDYIRFGNERRRTAIGFLPKRADCADMEIVVDPDNGFAESNEANNRCALGAGDPAPPHGNFQATAIIHFQDMAGQTPVSPLIIVAGTLSNPGDQVISLRFPTSLQMNFTIPGQFDWAETQAFPQVHTEVVVPPGGQHGWTITAPLPNSVDLSVEALVVTASLVGTDYSHTIRLRLDNNTEPDGNDGDDDASTGTNGSNLLNGIAIGDDIVEFIVSAAGIKFSVAPAATDAVAPLILVKRPMGGDLTETATGLNYVPQANFSGEDHAIVTITGANSPVRVMRRFKVGPQTFSISLDAGWNLVSFPIQPVSTWAEIAAVMSGLQAWEWKNGRYEPMAEVTVGAGVWLFSKSETTLTYIGEPEATVDVDLAPGWNLVGTVNDAAPPLAARAGDRKILDWRNNRYGIPDRLRSGKGYWMYVEGPETMELR